MYWLIASIAFLIILLLTFEAVFAKKRKISIYNFSDSFTNLYCGVLERVFDLVFSILILFVFDYIHKNFAILEFSFSIAIWILSSFADDLVIGEIVYRATGVNSFVSRNWMYTSLIWSANVVS